MYNICDMPEVKRIGQFKFYFYSNEPTRPHIHIKHSSGIETTVWLDDLISAWNEFFGVNDDK